MAGERQNDPLEIALAGTLAVGAAICIRMMAISDDMREGLSDKEAMAFFMTDSGIVSDSLAAQSKLNSASIGLRETEQLVALFAVCLGSIALALAYRVISRSVKKKSKSKRKIS